MIKTVDELKELILWAKSEKVKSLKIGDIIIEMSDLALIEDIQAKPEQANSKVTASVTTFMEDMASTGNKKEDEELLYWSAQS